jgi:hypothetical protein
MGEAKRKRDLAVPTIYHHTSTLRTNLLWMSGVIQLEGRSEGAMRPVLGEIFTDANLRREMRDFPPLAWFTTDINVPRCLIDVGFKGKSKVTGEIIDLPNVEGLGHAITLQRMAIGFPIADIPVVKWIDHAGYKTDEGQELNASARECGDDPDQWYVAETPVDLLAASEIWGAASVMKPKMRRAPAYLDDMKNMVRMCRADPGAFIPPSWLTPDQAKRLGERMGVETRSGRAALAAFDPLNAR